MRVATLSAAAAALLGTLAFAAVPVAAALEPGVHADPGSPAAKEYALPLNQARETGASRGGGQMFGSGIRGTAGTGRTAGGRAVGGSRGRQRSARRRSGRRGASPHGAGSSATGGRGNRGSTGGGSRSVSGALPPAVQSASRTRAGGGSSWLALLGGGVAVLVLGLLGGTVLKGHRSVSST